MKLNVIYGVMFFVICITIPWFTEAMSEENTKNMLKLAMKCKNKTGAKDEDVMHFMSKDLPDTRTTKCLYACMQELFGIITKEGRLKTQGIKNMAKLMFELDPYLRNVLMEIADECADVQDDDRCELAYKTSSCAIEAAKRRNIDYKKVFK
ncbi:general odorant-binding protein 19d-like [Lutzomyia longipalpis]|uniref:general odorant-binding protein 19d-like n=1 Tax=Lutzomyia longipalpis TaxID=7200 RepID=UPI002483C032|nr:general odorant-binding protein 19d-like [Lutzomyia longipalpis]